jgi:hypothetical protein
MPTEFFRKYGNPKRNESRDIPISYPHLLHLSPNLPRATLLSTEQIVSNSHSSAKLPSRTPEGKERHSQENLSAASDNVLPFVKYEKEGDGYSEYITIVHTAVQSYVDAHIFDPEGMSFSLQDVDEDTIIPKIDAFRNSVPSYSRSYIATLGQTLFKTPLAVATTQVCAYIWFIYHVISEVYQPNVYARCTVDMLDRVGTYLQTYLVDLRAHARSTLVEGLGDSILSYVMSSSIRQVIGTVNKSRLEEGATLHWWRHKLHVGNVPFTPVIKLPKRGRMDMLYKYYLPEPIVAGGNPREFQMFPKHDFPFYVVPVLTSINFLKVNRFLVHMIEHVYDVAFGPYIILRGREVDVERMLGPDDAPITAHTVLMQEEPGTNVTTVHLTGLLIFHEYKKVYHINSHGRRSDPYIYQHRALGELCSKKFPGYAQFYPDEMSDSFQHVDQLCPVWTYTIMILLLANHASFTYSELFTTWHQQVYGVPKLSDADVNKSTGYIIMVAKLFFILFEEFRNYYGLEPYHFRANRVDIEQQRALTRYAFQPRFYGS